MIFGAVNNYVLLVEKLKQQNVELIGVSELKPHEQVNEKRILEVRESIITEGLKYPIVVDKATKIILDGHHRYNILKKLKVSKVPVFFVNYFDERIILDSWNGAKLTKNDVVKKVNSGKLFPQKTTKHMFASEKGITHISSIIPAINLEILKTNAKHVDNKAKV